MLKFLNDHPEIYKELEDKGATLEEGIRENLGKTGIPGVVNRVGSMMTLFFSNAGQIYSYKYALTANTAMYAGYFKLAVENGIYIAPSQFESMFVSYAHTREDIEETVAKNLEALRILKNPKLWQVFYSIQLQVLFMPGLPYGTCDRPEGFCLHIKG